MLFRAFVHRSTTFVLCLSALCFLSACKRQLTVDERRGADLYQKNCAACHEERPEGLLKPPPSLQGIFRARTLPDGVPATDEAIREVILQGLHTMPAFQGRLNEEQLRYIIAYLHSRE